MRNSGADAVVEGVGDHGCEYMTGGHVVVLGPTGRNFAAGMSGGIAYVLDADGGFAARCNMELVELEPLDDERRAIVRALVEEHLERTGSPVAARVLDELGRALRRVRQGDAARLQAPRSPTLAAGNGAVALPRRASGLERRRGLRHRPRSRAGRAPADGRARRASSSSTGSRTRSATPAERVDDYHEFVGTLPASGSHEQGARCMECGVPFCHNGCPVNNLIPDWNDLVYRDRWQEAIEQLHRTNNFPEFTGRLCPAPCEAACVLEIREGEAVTIKQIELAIVEPRLGRGLGRARSRRARETGRSVAVIGAGPGRAGLRAAARAAPATR